MAAPVAAAIVMLAGTAAFAGSSDKAAAPHKPFRIYGNTYYVGSAGFASVLIASDYGYVLVDTGPKEIASQVAANIQELGFKLSELKAIVVSDARPEHAGGVGELQKLSGAQVYAMRPGEQKIHTEKLQDDPREGARVGANPQPPQVWVVQDDQLLGIASVRLRALATPVDAPEGASWSWDACDGSKCLATIFAASLEPEGSGKSHLKDHPEVQKSIEAGFVRLEGAPCELLLTPQPDASGGLARLEQAGGKMEALKNEGACKTYVQQARADLAK